MNIVIQRTKYSTGLVAGNGASKIRTKFESPFRAAIFPGRSNDKSVAHVARDCCVVGQEPTIVRCLKFTRTSRSRASAMVVGRAFGEDECDRCDLSAALWLCRSRNVVVIVVIVVVGDTEKSRPKEARRD